MIHPFPPLGSYWMQELANSDWYYLLSLIYLFPSPLTGAITGAKHKYSIDLKPFLGLWEACLQYLNSIIVTKLIKFRAEVFFYQKKSIIIEKFLYHLSISNCLIQTMGKITFSHLVKFVLNVALPLSDFLSDILFTYNAYRRGDINYFRTSGN